MTEMCLKKMASFVELEVSQNVPGNQEEYICVLQEVTSTKLTSVSKVIRQVFYAMSRRNGIL